MRKQYWDEGEEGEEGEERKDGVCVDPKMSIILTQSSLFFFS